MKEKELQLPYDCTLCGMRLNNRTEANNHDCEEKEKCENCKFGFPDEGIGHSDFNKKQCRKRAPVLTENSESGYPVKPNNHWCGDWEEKDNG